MKVVKDMPIRLEGRPLEAALMMGLDHPNIVRLVKHKYISRRRSDGSGGEPDVLWLVLEFCNRGHLEVKFPSKPCCVCCCKGRPGLRAAQSVCVTFLVLSRPPLSSSRRR